jgi:hypothetical protein
MNIKQAKQISIVSFLKSKGFVPEKETSQGSWFTSPFRSENTASFMVKLINNTWYDFGVGDGGNIIDLVLKMDNCSVSDALKYLSGNGLDNKPQIISLKVEKEPKEEEKSYEILEVLEIESNGLLEYATKERCVDMEIVKKYLREIRYKIKEQRYYALCFENNSNGMEVRNKYFKGCFGKKDITLIDNEYIKSQSVAVFEGFFDFLSAITYYSKYKMNILKDVDFLILNSTSLTKKAIHQIIKRSYKHVLLYLDNDNTGNCKKKEFVDMLSVKTDVTDKSCQYDGFDDFNEFLKSSVH